MRANALEPVTLVRSPTLTNKVFASINIGSSPDKRIGSTLLWSTEVVVSIGFVEEVMAHLAKKSEIAGERRWSPRLLRQQLKPDAAQ
jgi:hypothetical protein